MKYPLLTRLPLVLLLLLVTNVVTSAQPGAGHQAGPSQPLRQEIKAYLNATVLPVLRQQRQKLEAQLAPADQAQVVTYRAQLQALRAQGQALRQRIMPAEAPAGTRPTFTADQQQQVHALRLQAKSIMLSVAQLALKYDANIQKLTQEIAPQKAQWATDIKAIVAKNTTPEQQEKLAKWAGLAARRSGLRKLFRPAAFLLLDPTAPADGNLTSTNLYPNPAAATTQLQYDVKKAGPVSVELLDGNGAQLRTLLAPVQQERGSYTQQLDLSDLPHGTYYYKITTKAGTETKRFVKD
ncbi:T9SS type A sorting domain-containing protein [Hymenobacter baengnokdamensis]|uniref:T9SS type A sorting domain-containing protein n=1 Tax=Hymenobacter baengnokdamensis TaxID=2615203 RepID=UPI0012451437|nr:T9SS type A sorting domain-containing protein [Hymenobacter baengnokdamensis]